jgi:hypothetical protein
MKAAGERCTVFLKEYGSSVVRSVPGCRYTHEALVVLVDHVNGTATVRLPIGARMPPVGADARVVWVEADE